MYQSTTTQNHPGFVDSENHSVSRCPLVGIIGSRYDFVISLCSFDYYYLPFSNVIILIFILLQVLKNSRYRLNKL